VGLARKEKAPVPAESPMKATRQGGESGQDWADGGGAKGGLSAGEMNRRDLTKVLAMLSKKPDSTEFVYLRPYLADAHAAVSERLAPLNPYHIEVVRYPETSCCFVAQHQVAAPPTCATAPNLLLIQYLIYNCSATNTTATSHLADLLTLLHLLQVPHSLVEPSNYFTMSSFGVTHFLGGVPSFTDLARWQQERHIFLLLLKIPIFRKYRVWKSLLLWKNVVHWGKQVTYALYRHMPTCVDLC
jgi:hypothetical protein